MKFDCGETREEYVNRVKQWHLWFAWRPIMVGSHDCRWLETVERSIEYQPFGYDEVRIDSYRAKEN